jgi:hypothetical protein
VVLDASAQLKPDATTFEERDSDRRAFDEGIHQVVVGGVACDVPHVAQNGFSAVSDAGSLGEVIAAHPNSAKRQAGTASDQLILLEYRNRQAGFSGGERNRDSGDS